MLLELKVYQLTKGISYDGPLPVATIIKSRPTFHKFIERIYQVIGYEKQQHTFDGDM